MNNQENQFTKQFWTDRYQTKQTGWDAGTITTPLKEYIDQLRDKKSAILIPGAGNGHEAEYLFNAGFKNVTVIDISPEPIKNIQKRVPKFNPNNLVLGDFFEHTGSYDLIIEQTFFCALNPPLRKKYVNQMHALLKPAGKLVGVLFIEPLAAEHPPFGASKEEYTALLSPQFVIEKLEPCYNSIKPRNGKELFTVLSKKINKG
ncbi:MAG: methyltransferase domain-containing protein [Bacteroidia bacterium]